MAVWWFWVIVVAIVITLGHNFQLAKKKKFYQVENILFPLYKDPSDSSYARNIPSLLRAGQTYHTYNYAAIYDSALEILESNPDEIHLKTLCLSLGRLHYARLRDEHRPTIHDEKAIQNDIEMRLR